MKELGLLLLFPVAIIGLLRTELTPYRILSVSEIEQIKATAPAAKGVAAVPAQPVHDGQWMRDANYRSALEKSTVVGVPEASRSRERH